MRYLVVIFTILLLGCSQDKEIQYYENGRIKFEVVTRGGMRNGVAIGYFPTGEIKGKMTYKNGLREGEAIEYFKSGEVLGKALFHKDIELHSQIFLKTGELVEETFYDSLGRPQDFIHYLKNGKRDPNFNEIVLYTWPDSVGIGEDVTLFARLGNADSTVFDIGSLVITSGFDSNGFPIDTLFLHESNNKSGFRYSFKAKGKDENMLNTTLFFKSENGEISRPYSIIYKYNIR